MKWDLKIPQKALINLDYTNNTNKILLFSRYKETLDLINKQFLNVLFPTLKYLRIDGSIPAAKRFEIVKKVQPR